MQRFAWTNKRRTQLLKNRIFLLILHKVPFLEQTSVVGFVIFYTTNGIINICGYYP